MSKDMRGVENSLTIVARDVTDTRSPNVLTWLVTIDPTLNHNQACKLHEEHTCQWVLRSTEWINWIAGTIRFLWLYGIPGAGKTVMASFVNEQLRDLSKASVLPRGWCFYYCYHARNHDETTHFLRWIIKQLACQGSGISEELNSLYHQGGVDLSVSSLLKVLEAALSTFESVFVVIDAVDESFERENIIETLQRLASEPRFHKLQLLVTSRDVIDIRQGLVGLSVSISMANTYVDTDIRIYVRETLHSKSKKSKFRKWTEEQRNEVEEALVKGAKGMFRWAFCQIDILSRHKSPSAIREALTMLPNTLDETYERILASIPLEHRSYVIRALTLLVAATEVPIDTVGALVEAVTYDGTRKSVDFPNNLFDVDDLQEMCTCLILVAGTDKESKVVLAHYTVKEFLLSDRIATGSNADFHISNDLAKTLFLTTMFSYIMDCADSVVSKGLPFDSILSSYHQFCLDYWRYQLVDQEDHLTSDHAFLETLIQFLHPTRSHWDCIFAMPDPDPDDPRSFALRAERIRETAQLSTPAAILVTCSLLGLDEVALYLIDQRENFQEVLTAHLTIDPSRKLQGSLLDILAFIRDGKLMRGISKHGTGTLDDRNILFHAMRLDLEDFRGYDVPVDQGNLAAIIETACENGAKLDPSGFRFTPLQVAVILAHDEAVSALLRHGALPNGCGDPLGEIPAGYLISGRDTNEQVIDRFEERLIFPASLCDASPLYICRHRDEVEEGFDNYNRELVEKIEAVLLESGARRILNAREILDEDDDEVNTGTSDQPRRMEDNILTIT